MYPHSLPNRSSWDGAAQGLVKRFFNEKEVTSTLVMDALFSGCKQVEEASRAGIGPKVCGTPLHSSCLVLQTLHRQLFLTHGL